jgi:hypothetical protein
MSRSLNSPNRLLASLVPADFELLRPYLNPTELKNETVLYEAGDPVDWPHPLQPGAHRDRRFGGTPERVLRVLRNGDF